jgi:hypothetical protein
MVGGFVGGVVFLVSVMTGAFFYYRCRVRRRYLRARLILGGEEGIDGGADDVDKPAQSEDDMPPPDYQRIYPSTGITLLSRVGLAWPRVLDVKNLGANAAKHLPRDHKPPAQDIAPTVAKESVAMSRSTLVVTNRTAASQDTKDAVALGWEGRQPPGVVVVVAEISAGDSSSSGADLQGNDCKG